jgi:hypothetical protein
MTDEFLNITLEWETADRIALQSMQAHRELLKEAVARLKAIPAKKLANSQRIDLTDHEFYLEGFNRLIDYYGGVDE